MLYIIYIICYILYIYNIYNMLYIIYIIYMLYIIYVILPAKNIRFPLAVMYLIPYYWGADKSLARPGRKQATATEDFEFQISYL